MKIFIKNWIITLYSFIISLVLYWQFIINKFNITLGFITIKNILISIPIILISTLGLFFILKFLIQKIININFKKEDYSKKEIIKISILSFLIMLLIWTLCFLTYYPGGAIYDTYFQIESPIFATTQHPLGYSFLLYSFVRIIGYKILHNSVIGWAFYSIFQMILLSASISFALAFLMKRNISKKFIIFLILLYSFLPIYGAYSIYATKDVLFSIIILYLTLLVIKIIETKGKNLPNYYIYIYIYLLDLLCCKLEAME